MQTPTTTKSVLGSGTRLALRTGLAMNPTTPPGSYAAPTTCPRLLTPKSCVEEVPVRQPW